jgi:hypothetical protein
MSIRRPELEFEKNLKSSSRVLVINPLNTYWSYQLSSEIALRSHEFTPNVRWLNVGPKTPLKCEINLHDHYSMLIHGRVNRRVAKLLNKSGICTSEKLLKMKHADFSSGFNSVSELREMQFNEIPLGRMIFSAIASSLKSTAFELNDVRDQLDFFLWNAYESYAVISKEIEEFKPNLVLTINDRLIGSAMAVALAKQSKINFAIAYWGSSTNHIEDYSQSLYNAYEWETKISAKWSNRVDDSSSQAMIDAQDELSRLGKGPSSDSLRYLSEQFKGTLVDSKSEYCVFYAQSEHEHSGHLIINPCDRFASQYQAFEALQAVCKELGLTLFLKLHPLPKGEVSNSNIRKRLDWESVKLNEIVQIIEENSSIDTYELIVKAKYNIVWTSTVGLECIARGIAPIVLGFPSWLNRDWELHAWTEESLRKALLDDSRSINAQSLIPYFYYLNNFGAACRFSNRDLIWNEKGNEVQLIRFTLLGKLKKYFKLSKYFLRVTLFR